MNKYEFLVDDVYFFNYTSFSVFSAEKRLKENYPKVKSILLLTINGKGIE